MVSVLCGYGSGIQLVWCWYSFDVVLVWIDLVMCWYCSGMVLSSCLFCFGIVLVLALGKLLVLFWCGVGIVLVHV